MHDADGNSVTGFLVLFSTVLSASGAAWYWVFRTRQAGRPLLQAEPRSPVPWRLTDAVAIFLGWVFLQGVLPAVLRPLCGLGPLDREAPLSPDDLQVMMLSGLAANVLVGIGAPLWLWLGRGANAADLGLSANRVGGDLRRGAVAFAAVSVPVYALQMVLVWFVPSHHPLVKLLQETRDAATIVLSVLMAAVVAPIVEELLFRLVLQGALEAAQTRDPAGVLPRQPEPSEAEVARDPESWESINNPYAAPHALEDLSPPEIPSVSNARVWGLPLGVWPILISSTIFALLHWQHGPDPIPLFVLAVVLGWLYQRTHRLLPSIVVHVLLNSCSLAIFWLQPPVGLIANMFRH